MNETDKEEKRKSIRPSFLITDGCQPRKYTYIYMNVRILFDGTLITEKREILCDDNDAHKTMRRKLFFRDERGKKGSVLVMGMQTFL